MRAIRFPIAGLMLAVLVVALCLAILRNSSEIWAAVLFLFTCGVLCLAIVGVVSRDGPQRSWWLGFALFGWGYLLLSLWSTVTLPTMALLDVIAARLGMQVRFSGGMGGGMGGGFRSAGLLADGFGGGGGGPSNESLREIAHCLWALAAAFLGGLLARMIFGSSTARAEIRDTRAAYSAQTHGRWWLWPAILGLAGCVLIVLLCLIGSRSAPGMWVGSTFLITCGLLGVAVLGAAGDQGKRRQVWLGAAIFGIGYMTMAFGRPHDWETWPVLPTDHLLHALRHWFPPLVTGFPTASDGVAAMNARIWNALEQPISTRFKEDTPLEDVLAFIATATRGPDGKSIPIYVDPIGLQEVERSMNSHGAEPRSRRCRARDGFAPLPRPARPHLPHSGRLAADHVQRKRGRAGLSRPGLDRRTLPPCPARGRSGRLRGAALWCQTGRTCSSLSCLGSTVPGAPVMRSVPLAVLGKAMQSRMLVSPE